GGLKTPVKTRWITTWDCCDSIIRLEICLKNVLKTQPEIFHDSSVVKAIIQDHQFWHEVEKFQDVLAPAKRAVKNI
ncbi:3509_t:CDS:2, partial [Entrophospora sp. SA101]